MLTATKTKASEKSGVFLFIMVLILSQFTFCHIKGFVRERENMDITSDKTDIGGYFFFIFETPNF
jgi:hypothetical protein